jgi:hypothetical protein
MEEDVERVSNNRREIFQRLADLEKSVYNICWRLDKLEKDHEHARAL